MGRGPAPKDPARRARRNVDPVPGRVVPLERAPQPALPETLPNGDVWPAQTRAWWAMWNETPLSSDFGATDWSDLLDAATAHGRYWSGGSIEYLKELRLRSAKFGATPEDRARLRIQFAAADSAEAKRPEPRTSQRQVLHALPDAG